MNRRYTLNARTIPLITVNDVELDQNDSFENYDKSNGEKKNSISQTLKLQYEIESDSSFCGSALNPTVSHFSKLSRVTMNVNAYKKILQERAEHCVFSYLGEKDSKIKWFFESSEQKEEGPCDSVEMDSLFQGQRLQESTKVRRETEESFYPLSRVIKRYYCKFIADRKAALPEAPIVASTIIRFRKPTLHSVQPPKQKYTLGDNREARVLSTLPRPQLVFFGDESSESDCEDDEIVVSRARSQTLAN